MKFKGMVLLVLAIVPGVTLVLWFNRDHLIRTGSFEEFRFPEITLERLDGSPATIEVSNYSATVVMFWATWCDACKDDLEMMRTMATRSEFSDVGFFAVSKDDNRDDVVALLGRMGISGEFQVLRDAGDAVSPLFEVYAVPETFIVSRKGVVVRRFVGAIGSDLGEFTYALERVRRAGLLPQ